VVIFLFGLEALLATVSRARSSVDLSLHQTQAAIGSYNDQTSFEFVSRFCVVPGTILFCPNVVIGFLLHSLPV
jgi:hypothetical protein